MNDEPALTHEEKRGERIPIVRGSNFQQVYADAFLSLPLNSGIDIAVLAATPLIQGEGFLVLTDSQGIEKLSAGQIDPKSSFTEVCRIRLDPDGFENLLGILIGAATQSEILEPGNVKIMLESALKDLETKND